MHLIDQQLNLMVRGQFKEAWKICQKLEKEMPDDLRHMFNRAWFILNQGDLQKGMQMLDKGRFLNVYGNPPLTSGKPLWNTKDSLEGKTVIINLEGGLGDEIIHARFATDVHKRGGKAILCCSEQLKDVLSTIPGVYKCINISELSSTPHDYWVPGFSCAWLFGHTFDTLPNDPYITANPKSVELWKNVIKGDKPKIGIRWSGNPKFEHQQFRIFPAEHLIDFAKYDEFQFYSLQRDNDIKELPDNIIDLQHKLLSWVDTAAAIQNLDLVITSCTSIAHISAAMGKPTWVISPILPYHIWAYGDKTTPWYKDSTRVYKQKTFCKWDDTFLEIENDLIKYFKDNKKTLNKKKLKLKKIKTL